MKKAYGRGTTRKRAESYVDKIYKKFDLVQLNQKELKKLKRANLERYSKYIERDKQIQFGIYERNYDKRFLENYGKFFEEIGANELGLALQENADYLVDYISPKQMQELASKFKPIGLYSKFDREEMLDTEQIFWDSLNSVLNSNQLDLIYDLLIH